MAKLRRGRTSCYFSGGLIDKNKKYNRPAAAALQLQQIIKRDRSRRRRRGFSSEIDQ